MTPEEQAEFEAVHKMALAEANELPPEELTSTEPDADVKQEQVNQGSAPQKDSQPETPQQSQEIGLRPPVKIDGEPEWRYNFRMEMYQKNVEIQEAIKNGASESEVTALRQEKSAIRKDLEKVAQEEKSITKSVSPDLQNDEDFTEEEQDREILKKYGVVTESDLDRILEERISKIDSVKRFEQDALSAQQDFFKEHPEYANPEMQELLLQTVEETFNINGANYSKLRAYFDIAHKEILFPEDINSKIERSIKVEEAVQALGFGGNTSGTQVPKTTREDKMYSEALESFPGLKFED